VTPPPLDPDLKQTMVTAGLGEPDAREHVYIVTEGVLMVSVKGILTETWTAMPREQQEREFAAGSAYLTVSRDRVGLVYRGSILKSGRFKRLPLLTATRLAGGNVRLRGLERWLLQRAAITWGSAWEEHYKRLPDPGFDIVHADLNQPPIVEST